MQNENKKKIIISISLIILLIGFIIYIIIDNNKYEELDLGNIVTKNNSSEIENTEVNMQEVSKDENKIEEEIETIIIHITGEVKKEGIVYLEKGDRIVDAIKKAGGETEEADLSQINLAYELQDGQKIYVPNRNEKISEYITGSTGNNGIVEENDSSSVLKGEEKKVNINTASQSELDELPGIGPAIAQRIVEYRNENGNFKKIEDLQNVKGIGDAKFSEIKDLVTV